LLADLAPTAHLTHDLAAADAAAAAGGLALLAPSALLRQHDPLPHSWDVSSDAIAAWLAAYLPAPLLVLLKSMPGVLPDGHRPDDAPLPTVSPNDAARYNVVDSYFARALAETTTCWLIDGHRPERLAELLATGHTLGTRVVR
jgi:5-(aminomethyl)-3-furanmethanol phosphate kinase